MRFLIRALLFLIVLGALCIGVAYLAAPRVIAGPVIELRSPEKFVGQNSSLEFLVQAPASRFSKVEATLEQEGQSTTVFSLDPAKAGNAEVKQDSADRMWVIRRIGRQTIPTLKAGPARLTITAARPVLYGLRDVSTTTTRDLQVRLEPPRVAVVSLHHFVNHGSAEFVVLRATPADVQAGVRVGDHEYRSYPGTSVGISDPAVRVAFFALSYDQDLKTPITVFARDEAANQATSAFDYRVFPKPFAHSKIIVDDAFMQKVVPQIAETAPEANIPTDNLLNGFLKINRDLRKENNAKIASMATKSRPEMMWREGFSLGNINVEARFADFRTYYYQDKEIDRQVHLGYDLATLQHAPIEAANRGVVIYAAPLGIYGNAVILDHGLGVQSLYGHMLTSDVKEGDAVEKGQTIGKTDSTGLAAGDHLHFTMIVDGVMVSPVEWWDPHWMEDRVFRKIREAGGKAPERAGATAPKATKRRAG
ncbi:MAG TPA: M23 family metallopeptidase [Vicinamibacterales bacterium]|nr:M23 family metallopeptidase [Vicinamibacterales bacterium]